jgi:acetylornithine deacetylase/succinyl-diaminopimelate desuccinylase-like protein
MTHLATLRAFGGRPPVGVTLFVEGEEESGSPTLPALLAEHRDALAADVIVIADAANPAVDVPALTTSLRGLTNVVVEVSMLERAVHSGMLGGPAGDALTALCRLLATLHDDKGEAAVAGLVRGSSAAPDVEEETFRGDAGLLEGVDLLGTGTITERLTHKPAISVLGIDAPAVDGSANVLLPRARAMISVRLAPGDATADALAALREHLATHVPWGAHLEITLQASGEPFALEPSGSIYDLARDALSAAFEHAAVEVGMGGTVPFIAEFARTFPGATVLVTGVGDPASRWHGVDESLHLGMFSRCVLAETMLLRSLAEPARS